MFPEEFRQRIRKQKYIDADELLHGLACPSSVSIRINRKKRNRIPENSDPVTWCRDGFYLDIRPSFTLDPLFHSGCYYPQEASGMFLEEVYRQIVGEARDLNILDLCGAPGGKATHLSTLIGDKGCLVANEVIRSRATVLAENLTKWGSSNSIVTQSDPSAFSRLPGFFDMILADAPCSGEGMFHDKRAVDEWSENNTALCSSRQKRILTDVWPALKEDGILIYSTCTFNPDENEKNIKWLTDNKKAESIRINISDYPGITEIEYNNIFGYGFFPGRIRGEGLFISVLRKKESHGNSMSKAWKSTSHFTKVTAKESEQAKRWSLFIDNSLVKMEPDVYSLPLPLDKFRVLSEHLLVVKPGTQILTVKKKNIIPSHELALSVYFRKNVIPEINFTAEQALNYLRREKIMIKDAPEGWMTACYTGVNLGFMNNIGSRINNYYPVEWRIRMPFSGKSEKIVEWT